MSFSGGENDAQTGDMGPCPNGHDVAGNNLFCPVCLELVARFPATYWTVNDARDLHPSAAARTEDSSHRRSTVRYVGGYCPKRPE